jgi:ArsR family transcriptional regulator, arsenate/arsenite/antimonite-responsive transcriptional repressor
MGGGDLHAYSVAQTYKLRPHAELKERIVKHADAAERLKALGHPVRLAIVRALAEQSCCCCGDVCSRLPLAQSTVSQHLKVLKDAGLISFRRDGVRSSYVLNLAAFSALRHDLEEIVALLPDQRAIASVEAE